MIKKWSQANKNKKKPYKNQNLKKFKSRWKDQRQNNNLNLNLKIDNFLTKNLDKRENLEGCKYEKNNKLMYPLIQRIR